MLTSCSYKHGFWFSRYAANHSLLSKLNPRYAANESLMYMYLYIVHKHQHQIVTSMWVKLVCDACTICIIVNTEIAKRMKFRVNHRHPHCLNMFNTISLLGYIDCKLAKGNKIYNAVSLSTSQDKVYICTYYWFSDLLHIVYPSQLVSSPISYILLHPCTFLWLFSIAHSVLIIIEFYSFLFCIDVQILIVL